VETSCFERRLCFNLPQRRSSTVASVFKSVEHPEGRPTAVVYSHRLARPLAACVIPVMIGAAAAVLQGEPAWGYLVWGLPCALVAASLWTQFMMVRTPAEVHLQPGQAAVQSIHDVLYERPLIWHALHYVRTGRGYVELSVGWQTYVCRPRKWRHFNKLCDRAEQAFKSPSGEATPSF